MVEFAQRPMVAQGIPPSAPSSEGTGITSGLMEPPAKVLEEGMMSAQASVENSFWWRRITLPRCYGLCKR